MKLKRVYCKHFPFSGYLALTLYPWVFIREGARQRYTPTVNRHETTHALQQIELLWLLFFILYGLEWLIKIPFCKFNTHDAYKSISFEQEAYTNQGKVDYNKKRRHYAWVKYVFKLYKN